MVIQLLKFTKSVTNIIDEPKYKHRQQEQQGTTTEFKEALSVDSTQTVQPDVSFMEQGGNSLVIVRLSSLIQDRTPSGQNRRHIFPSYNYVIGDIY